jgi:hypothetical protein
MKGIEVKRIYGFIRKLVPEKIDIENEKEYQVTILEKTKVINITHDGDLIYLCNFKTPSNEKSDN